MSRMKRPLIPLVDVDDEPLPPDVMKSPQAACEEYAPTPEPKNPKRAPIRQVMSWADKIRLPQERAMDRGEPYFEVHYDGHRFVSLLTIDVTGDNTLVYMTRGDVNKLIKKLERARDRLPQRKTTKRRKRK